MAVDPHHTQPGQGGGVPVGGQRVLVRDAKFVALQPGGNVGVRFGVHVGVDAQADRRAQAQRGGHLAQHVQLGLALDVEAADARLQRLPHFGARLADARKNHLGRIPAGGQHALQLAA